MAETLPIELDLVVFMNTDNVFDFPIVDENDVQLDVTGWTADLEVDKSAQHTTIKRTFTASVVTDPLDGTKTVLRVPIPDDTLQPGSALTEWREGLFPYSLRRMDDGLEKILTYGNFDVRRKRL